MASGFLSGQREELGSGGKAVRGRRRLLPSFSPYSRPASSAALMPHTRPEAQTGRRLNWLKGLISGVGKLFLSVLGSEDNSPSPSECFSDSDEYYDYSPNEHEDRLRSDDLTAFKMRESGLEKNVESLAIMPKSETKLIVEQLLMQETFTREECNKLVEIIQSRVPDVNSVEIGVETQNVVPTSVTDQGQSLNHNRNLFGISNFSPKVLSSFSPRFYAQETVFPDLRNKAVMEAKKWFEEKKLSPSPPYDQNYQPCILNPRMNQYRLEEDVGSPIEMAKSYMQSLPPWRSPSFSTIGLKTTPSCGNSTCNFGSHLLTTSEVKKSDYLAIGSFKSEENHRTHLKSFENEQEFSMLGQSKLFSTHSVPEAETIPTAAPEICNEVQGKCLELQYGNPTGADQLMETDNGISVGGVLQPKEVFKESQEGPNVAASNNIEQLHYDIVNMLPNDADMSVSDLSQVNCVNNVKTPLATEEQLTCISAPQDSLLFDSIADMNNGDSFPETETLQLENITPADPSIVDKNSGDEVIFRAFDSMQVDVDAAFNNTHPMTGNDSEQPDEHPQTHEEEAIVSGENFETSSNLAEINTKTSEFELMSKGDPTATSASYGGAPAASASEGDLEPTSDVSVAVRRTRASMNARKSQSTNVKPADPMLTEPPEPSRGNNNRRKAKKVLKQKKWRG